MKWYLYVAQCEDGSLYTGITTDVATRLQEHNAGQGSKYVRSKGAARLVYSEPHASRSLAQQREIEVKGWAREKKLTLLTGHHG